MYCNTEFTYDRLHDSLSKAMHDKIRTHQAAMLMSRQRSLLPSTQPLVIERRKLGSMKNTLKDMVAEANRLRQLLNTQKVLINEMTRDIKRIESGNISLPESADDDDENVSIGEKCSVEDCRGFLNRARKCLICSTYSCKHCLESKSSRNDTNHVCNPDVVATVSLLKKDTKNCPSCSIPIHKIMGCSQMYCVQCHTAFDWNTLRIVTGVIHNPHYYELRREGIHNIRNGGDLECGGLPNLSAYFNKVPAASPLRQCHRLIGHINAIEIVNYPLDENIIKFRDLRVRFLSEEITEKDWISSLKKEQKKLLRSREIRMLFDTLVQCLTSITQRIMNTTPMGNQEIESFENELTRIIQYINTQFLNLRKKFNIQRIPRITPRLVVTYHNR